VTTVRGLANDLRLSGVNVVLLDIHTSPGAELLDTFDFVSSPTYLLFDRRGGELWRGNRLPEEGVLALAQNG
jgi:hypothetical protein